MAIRYILTALAAALGLYLLLLLAAALSVNPRKEYSSPGRFHRFALLSATRAALWLLRVRVHVRGGEKLPRDQRLLFVGNHISNFDPIVTWHAFRDRRIGFISKPSNFKIPIFGRIVRRCCFLPIDREDPRKAIVTINAASELLASGEVDMAVYPEGTRSRTGELLAFHNGVFKIAKKAGTGVAVVHVSGTDRIRKNAPWHPTDVYLEVLEVIPRESVSAADTRTLGTAVAHLLRQAGKEKEREK